MLRHREGEEAEKDSDFLSSLVLQQQVSEVSLLNCFVIVS